MKMFEKMERTYICEVLEESEKTGWTDEIAEEAFEVLDPFIDEIESNFGKDLTTDVFLVTCYVAAKDPQCKTRKDFDRLCGLSENGVHSLISHNLICPDNTGIRNSNNKKAARYIYHKVKEMS